MGYLATNDLETGVMGADRNRVVLVSASGEEAWPEMDKDELATRLVARIAERLGR